MKKSVKGMNGKVLRSASGKPIAAELFQHDILQDEFEQTENATDTIAFLRAKYGDDVNILPHLLEQAKKEQGLR